MRKMLGVTTVLCLVLGLTASAQRGPETVTIKEAAKKLAGVPFAHQKHSATVKQCDQCHHSNKGMTADNAGKMKVEKCSACHLDPKPDVPSMRDGSLQKNPFHSLCIGCHKQQKKGPTLCKDCHKK